MATGFLLATPSRPNLGARMGFVDGFRTLKSKLILNISSGCCDGVSEPIVVGSVQRWRRQINTKIKLSIRSELKIHFLFTSALRVSLRSQRRSRALLHPKKTEGPLCRRIKSISRSGVSTCRKHQRSILSAGLSSLSKGWTALGNQASVNCYATVYRDQDVS